VPVDIPPLVFPPGQLFDVFTVTVRNTTVPPDWPHDGVYVSRLTRIGDSVKAEILRPTKREGGR